MDKQTIVRADEKALKYLKNLDRALTKISMQNQEEFIMQKEIKNIRNILNFLRYDERGGIHEQIIIDKETGFPLITTILGLYHNKEKSGEELLEIGIKLLEEGRGNNIQVIEGENSLEKIETQINQMIAGIVKEKIYNFSDRTFERFKDKLEEYYKREELMLRRTIYASKLSSTKLLGNFKDGCQKQVEMQGEYPEQKFHSCRASLAGFNSAEGLFNKYILTLFFRKYGKYMAEGLEAMFEGGGPTQKFSNLLDLCFGNSLETIFEAVQKEEDFAVQNLDKYTLGPFYDSEMPRELEGIVKDKEFSLKATKESLSHEIKEYPFNYGLILRHKKPFGQVTNEKIEYYVCSSAISEKMQEKYPKARILKIEEKKKEEK